MSPLDLLPPDLAPAVHFEWPGRLYLFLLIAGVPLLSALQPRGAAEMDLPPRSLLYVSSVAVIWILAGLTGLALLVEEVPLDRIGLHGASAAELAGWALGVTAGVLISSFIVTRIGAALGARESRLVFHLLPTNARERWSFVGVSASAGFCEELVYHGYAIAGLAAWLESGWWAAAVANLAFGVLHGYQNLVGVVRAGLMGYVLSLPVIAGAGLLPGMIAHFGVNAALGLGLWRWILPPQAEAPDG